MKKRIALISDSRASHSIYVPVLNALQDDDDFEYMYVLCGMHLEERFGKTIDEVREQGYTVHHQFPFLYPDDSKATQATNIGQAIENLTRIFREDRPDFILAQGDRGIALAAAIVGSHMRIPVGHMHGGEVSGTVDELVRHAISKLSHFHFPSSKLSAKRLRMMGEAKARIHLVGAAGIEYIETLMKEQENEEEGEIIGKETLTKYGVNVSQDYVVVLQHPVSGEDSVAKEHMDMTLQAVEELGLQTLIIYPNSDAGNKGIIVSIEEHTAKNKESLNWVTHKNIPYLDYLSILNNAKCLIGNSSGAIIEAPSLALPVVNIGNRQMDREHAKNIIDVKYDKEDIRKAIMKSLEDKEFLAVVKRRETPYNPFGDGKIAMRILDVFREIDVNEKLFDKRLVFEE